MVHAGTKYRISDVSHHQQSNTEHNQRENEFVGNPITSYTRRAQLRTTTSFAFDFCAFFRSNPKSNHLFVPNMQAQIFPRGTYAPTMGVYNFAHDPKTMAENVTVLFGAPTQSSTSASRQPRFTAASHYASMRSSSPPQSSHLSSDESEISEEEENTTSCHPSVSQKLSRAFKSLRKMSGGK